MGLSFMAAGVSWEYLHVKSRTDFQAIIVTTVMYVFY